MPLRGFRYSRDRVHKQRMVELVRDAEAVTKIVGADKQHVDSLRGRDCIDLCDRTRGLNLNHGCDQRVAVRMIILPVSTKPCGAIRFGNAAYAMRRISHCRHRLARLGS